MDRTAALMQAAHGLASAVLTGPVCGAVAVGLLAFGITLAACVAASPRGAGGTKSPPCPLGTIASLEAERPSCEDDPVATPKKKAWEDARGGQEAARPHVRARLSGWPERVLVERQTLPAADREFLERLARDTWRGLDALTDRENGLPVDHVRLGEGAGGRIDARVGDYTNITNVGLHLIAVVAAHELDLVSAPDAIEKIRRVLDTLERLETHHNLFFNYYDTTSLERSSNFLSFIDSAWLTAGLMVVRMTFPQLHDRASKLIGRMDYGFFYDPKLGYMSHGYYVHRRSRSRYHYGVLYTEARLGSLIAIGKGDVPETVWFDMVRTYPAECAGQTSPPIDTKLKRIRGHEVFAGHYEWRGLEYVPSWGGSMFEALMPSLVLDELRYAPKSLGANDLLHVTVQRRYATEQLGYPVWGMSSSAMPAGDGYREYGVRVLGARGYRAGAVTPHAAALALLVTPDAALASLRKLTQLYDIYGEYGFYDAVDPASGQVARTYLTLDQAMVFIAAANHLKPHCIQERFASDPIAQRALPIIGEEDFFD
jgi:hypothetical protein